jgi:hypothetical protein
VQTKITTTNTTKNAIGSHSAFALGTFPFKNTKKILKNTSKIIERAAITTSIDGTVGLFMRIKLDEEIKEKNAANSASAVKT